jgi:hypothetical protein
MKITKSKLIELIKEELEAVLAEQGSDRGLKEMDTNPYRVQPGGREHEAEKAASVKFTRGPCKGMTAKEAMKSGCKPGRCDHIKSDEDYEQCIKTQQ